MVHYFCLYTSTEKYYYPSRHRPAWIYSQESAWKGSVSDFYVLHYYNGMFHEHIQTTVSWKKDQYKISPFSHFLFYFPFLSTSACLHSIWVTLVAYIVEFDCGLMNVFWWYFPRELLMLILFLFTCRSFAMYLIYWDGTTGVWFTSSNWNLWTRF